MDNFFLLLIELLIHQSLSPERPKIDVRLLSCFPNNKNKLDIEVENITNNEIELASATIALRNNGSRKLFFLALNLTEEQLILPPFSPQKMHFTITEREKTKRIIKYFEFKLVEKKTRIKVFPINMFKNHND